MGRLLGTNGVCPPCTVRIVHSFTINEKIVHFRLLFCLYSDRPREHHSLFRSILSGSLGTFTRTALRRARTVRCDRMHHCMRHIKHAALCARKPNELDSLPPQLGLPKGLQRSGGYPVVDPVEIQAHAGTSRRSLNLAAYRAAYSCLVPAVFCRSWELFSLSLSLSLSLSSFRATARLRLPSG